MKWLPSDIDTLNNILIGVKGAPRPPQCGIGLIRCLQEIFFSLNVGFAFANALMSNYPFNWTQDHKVTRPPRRQ